MGNKNNFVDKEQCLKACREPSVKSINTDVCSLEKQTGFCRGYNERYFYNSQTNECQQFIYGGNLEFINFFFLKVKKKFQNLQKVVEEMKITLKRSKTAIKFAKNRRFQEVSQVKIYFFIFLKIKNQK